MNNLGQNLNNMNVLFCDILNTKYVRVLFDYLLFAKSNDISDSVGCGSNELEDVFLRFFLTK